MQLFTRVLVRTSSLLDALYTTSRIRALWAMAATHGIEDADIRTREFQEKCVV
jgi:hypothetical protein